MNKMRVLLSVSTCLVMATAAPADYYYYGVAAAHSTDANDYLWGTLSQFPEWSGYSPTSVTGSESWSSSTHVVLHDNPTGPQVLSGIYSFTSYLSDDDFFLFHYNAHGGWDASDSDADDGSTSRPQTNDPHPDQTPPYEYDEALGYDADDSGDWGPGEWSSDDDIAGAFADVPAGASVLTIFDTCRAGGMVGGNSDMESSAPGTNDGLYVGMATPEQGVAIGIGASGETCIGLLTRALANTAQGTRTADQWFHDALDYGTTATTHVSGGDRYWWPEDNSTLSGTWSGDHWQWQETYLQLRPIYWTSMDAVHGDVAVFTPEPATVALFSLGLLGLAARLRRNR